MACPAQRPPYLFDIVRQCQSRKNYQLSRCVKVYSDAIDVTQSADIGYMCEERGKV